MKRYFSIFFTTAMLLALIYPGLGFSLKAVKRIVRKIYP